MESVLRCQSIVSKKSEDVSPLVALCRAHYTRSTRGTGQIVTKIARKPRGIGAELKAAADGESGIVLYLEMIEGDEREKMKQWHADWSQLRSANEMCGEV